MWIHFFLMDIKDWQDNIKIFSIEYKQVKVYCDVCNRYRKSKKLKYPTFFKKH